MKLSVGRKKTGQKERVRVREIEFSLPRTSRKIEIRRRHG